MLGLCPLTSLIVPADWQVEGGWLGLCWHGELLSLLRTPMA